MGPDDLPPNYTTTLAGATRQTSGAMTSAGTFGVEGLGPYGGDVYIRRSIVHMTGTIGVLDSTNLSSDTGLVFCLGLTFRDSLQATSGVVANVATGANEGPFEKSNSSMYYIVCCISFPLGDLFQRNARATIQLRSTEGSTMTITQAAQGGWQWWCYHDSKVIRKLHGLDYPELQLVGETRLADSSATTGIEIRSKVVQANARHVLTT